MTAGNEDEQLARMSEEDGEQAFHCLLVFVVPLIIGIIALAWSREAHGFPDMVRHGYGSCISCHTAPSGGGALTGYGRMISNQVLSTYVAPDAKPNSPDWVEYGGNYRTMSVRNRTSEGAVSYLHFPMQAELEGVIYLNPGFAVAGTVGTYGPEQKQEYRRNYVMVKVGDYVRFRAGRFLPAYGLNEPDHTLWTRELLGLGEGQEQLAGEVSVVTKWGELILTHALGHEATFLGRTDNGYGVKPEDVQENYARLQVYATRAIQVGLSGKHSLGRLQTYGVQAFYAPLAWLYSEGEADFSKELNGPVTFLKLGLEPVQGLHVLLTHEYTKDNQRPGAGIEWFPMPGIDVLLKAQRVTGKEPGDELTAVLHVYL